jgi:hypothetical protein
MQRFIGRPLKKPIKTLNADKKVVVRGINFGGAELVSAPAEFAAAAA